MLRTRREIVEARESFAEKLRADLRESLHQLGRRFFLADRSFLLQQDWTSVERGLDEHRRHARLDLAIDYGPVRRRSAAIEWQQRKVNVDTTATRRAQELIGKN